MISGYGVTRLMHAHVTYSMQNHTQPSKNLMFWKGMVNDLFGTQPCHPEIGSQTPPPSLAREPTLKVFCKKVLFL